MVDFTKYNQEEKNKIPNLIDKVNTTESLPRPYLGMSQLGDSCYRKLWYYFRWTYKDKIDGRVNRIFQVGHKAEVDMINALESIGVKTWDTLDDQAGFQAVQNHCRGHSDGMALGIPGAEKTTHLLEFKTSSDKYFKQIVKNGVQKVKPIHVAQMQLYMYFSKTTRALYMVYNKNDSSYYCERIDADKFIAEDLISKAEDIITTDDVNTFPKIGNGSPSYYECKFCNAADLCHFNDKPVKTCRTCTSADIIDDGKWQCSINKKILSTDDQAKACDCYNVLECFDE